MNITGTRWHINNKIIQFTPVYIGYKLPDGGACHWSAPYYSAFFIYQQANTHQLYAKAFQWNDKALSIYLFHHRALAAYTKHNGHTRSVNISIHQPYACAILCKCKSEVSGYCALAHTTFTAHHGYDIFHTRQYFAFIISLGSSM